MSVPTQTFLWSYVKSEGGCFMLAPLDAGHSRVPGSMRILPGCCATLGREWRGARQLLFESRWESTRNQSTLGKWKPKVLPHLCSFTSTGETSRHSREIAPLLPVPSRSRLWPRSPTQAGCSHIPLLLPQVSLREGTSHQEQTCLAPSKGNLHPRLA